jgi:hypothetical protein
VALTTLDKLLSVPLLKKQPTEFLSLLLTGASRLIVTHCKHELEQATYVEYGSGDDRPDLILRQWPVGSVTEVRLDPAGCWGQNASGFPASSVLTAGTDYGLVYDSGTTSKRGILRRVGGSSVGWPLGWPQATGQGKLGGRLLPGWPRGDGNIRVTYVAGYATIPDDLQLACVEMVAWLARNVPVGASVTQESLGSYSYGLGSQMIGTAPELGTVKSLLVAYRDRPI